MPIGLFSLLCNLSFVNKLSFTNFITKSDWNSDSIRKLFQSLVGRVSKGNQKKTTNMKIDLKQLPKDCAIVFLQNLHGFTTKIIPNTMRLSTLAELINELKTDPSVIKPKEPEVCYSFLVLEKNTEIPLDSHSFHVSNGHNYLEITIAHVEYVFQLRTFPPYHTGEIICN